MKKLILIISWLCFAQGLAYAQKMISLWDASQSNQIKVYACWNTKYNLVYGQNLFLRVTNLQKQKLTIIVRPGETTFLSHNPGYQNQMVVTVDTMVIAASATDSILLYSNCIGHAKQCPGYGNEFSLIAQTDVDLQNMAEYISQKGYY